MILTLCFQTTLYAAGFACILHSKYTSSPSSISSGFKLDPRPSLMSGPTEIQNIKYFINNQKFIKILEIQIESLLIFVVFAMF